MFQSHTWQPGTQYMPSKLHYISVDQKILSIGKEPMLSGFLTLNAQSILPHTEIKQIKML